MPLLAAVALLFASAAAREQIARKYAPVIFQETNHPIKDLYAAFDFDGNWNGDDNSENMQCWFDPSKCNTACAGQKCPLVATVYYTVIETKTHWFVQYLPYHPLDWKLLNGHEHDTESMLAVIAKASGLQALETRFHLSWFQYAADSSILAGADTVKGPIHFDSQSGRPAIYSQMVGHGLCGGFAPPNYLLPDLQLLCDHAQAPHIERTGVRYSPDTSPIAMPQVVANATVNAGYRLIELATSIWPHIREIGPGKAFQSAIDYRGERCDLFSCPAGIGGAWEGNEGSPPAEPWGQPGGLGVNAIGDQFFDPAYTMSKRLSFPEPFSLDYCFNPYLGVADTCDAGVSDAGTTSDAGITAADAGNAIDAGNETDAGNTTAPAPHGCNSTSGAGLLCVLFVTFALAGKIRCRSRLGS